MEYSLAPVSTPPKPYHGPEFDLLSVTEVAAAARVTVRSLNNYWNAGSGPPRTRIGGRIFVTRASLAAWLAARTDSLPTHQPNQPHPAAAA
jgi:hypothetical protein